MVRPDGNGGLTWSLDSNGNGVVDAGDTVYTFGASTDQPVIGDWNAAGKDQIGVYRPDLARNSLAFTLDANGDGVFDGGDQVFDFGSPGDTVLSGMWAQPGSQLDAAPGATLPAVPPLPLTAATLTPVLDQAIDTWMATGLDAQQKQLLEHLTVQVTTLDNGLLGYTQGEHIELDSRAAGFGWFVDPTPADNSEFPLETNAGLQADSASPAAGKMDLFTVLMHEMGHTLGLGDLNPSLFPHDLMNGSLPVGTRRFPTFGEANVSP